jgi:hypothetical protein
MTSKPRRKTARRGAPARVELEPQNRTHWLGEKSLYITGAIFLVHVLGLASLFAPWTGIFDTQPIIEQDWGLHFHHLAALEAFWRQDRLVWGYNPFFMAGYPSNTIQDLSIKFFEFAALGLSALAPTLLQWFKISAFLVMASVPWLGYFTARIFFFADGRKNLIALTAAFLATVYWWNSLPREMFFYGMIGFPAAAYLSVLGVSLFYRLAAHGESFGWVHIGCLLFAAVILPLHVQSAVIFLPPIVALLAFAPQLLSVRLFSWGAAALLVAVLSNLMWLAPALEHRGDDISAAIVEQLPLFAGDNPFTFFLDYLGPQGFWTFRAPLFEKGLRLALLALGVLGIRRLMQNGDRSAGVLLASAVGGLFILTYFGGLVPGVKSWQPLRFKVALDLFLVLGAAHAAASWLGSRRAAPSKLVPVLLGCGLITFLVNVVQTESTGKLQLRTRLNPQITAVVDWIARETAADARVLFEESGDETGFVYDGVYLSSLLPQLTGRQFIGGPINLYNDRHHFAEFHSGRVFKKNIQTLSDGELRNYLRLYNIGAIVAFHPASIRRLQAAGDLVTLEQRIGLVHLMKVRQPLSWFVKGEGKVDAGWNRLELSDLAGDEVVLKYHWVQGLSASPPVKIEPVKILDDPIPFIKLVKPPARVILRVGSME